MITFLVYVILRAFKVFLAHRECLFFLEKVSFFMIHIEKMVPKMAKTYNFLAFCALAWLDECVKRQGGDVF
jgi:hypothetical protein